MVIREYDVHLLLTHIKGVLPSILWILGSMLLHIGFSVTFVVTFVRSLGDLAQVGGWVGGWAGD